MKMSSRRKITIGVTGCRKIIDGQPYDVAGRKYLAAIEDACDALPLIIPTTGDPDQRRAILNAVDGLLFTGSHSNVEPRHYGGDDTVDTTPHDPFRDAVTLPLIREAVSAGKPVLCICRGFQELNVAYGGTLHPEVHLAKDMNDHREIDTPDLDVRYGPVHEVTLRVGGLLAEIAGAGKIDVNSLHRQGINRLGDGLQSEARASDGLIEAVTVEEATSFALGVQWHPEFKVMENAFYRDTFLAFARSCLTK
jgi:putative glutamine amidotransferase